MGDSIKFAKDYAESMARMSGHSVCITDKEQIIAAFGAEKKELMEQKLSQELEDAIHERKKKYVQLRMIKNMSMLQIILVIHSMLRLSVLLYQQAMCLVLL